MAAATADINTPERAGEVVNLPVAASTKIYAGTMVAIDASGNAKPAADTAGLTVIGRAEEFIDNSSGAAGDLTINVKRGVFKYNNSGTNAVDADDKAKVCYIEDDNTVQEAIGTNAIVAGLVLEVADGGVWVDQSLNGVRGTVVTLGNADNEIGALAIGGTYTQAEVVALRDKAEELADDVRNMHAALRLRGLV